MWMLEISGVVLEGRKWNPKWLARAANGLDSAVRIAVMSDILQSVRSMDPPADRIICAGYLTLKIGIGPAALVGARMELLSSPGTWSCPPVVPETTIPE